MKKQKSRKSEKTAAVPQPDLKAEKSGSEQTAPMSILELAASFWDAGRAYPTERRA